MSLARPADAVAVVGCGWAGLAAAVALARAGIAPRVFEAAPDAGGRARAIRIRLAGEEVELDNGQHLLLGAYAESLRLIDAVSGNAPPALRRAPLRLDGTDGLRFVPWRLPAPLHLAAGLLTARGLSMAERLALARMLLALRARGWRAEPGETVDAMLSRLRQPEALRRRLWAPLVVAALNTAPHEACAQTFANVLRDSLGARRPASDFVLADPDLSSLLARPAMRWLEANGARAELRTQVRALHAVDGQWRLDTSAGEFAARAVVLAVPPFAAARLLAPIAGDDRGRLGVLDALAAYQYDSIATVYLGWRDGPVPRLPPWVMLEEHHERGEWGQWLFDRGVHGVGKNGGHGVGENAGHGVGKHGGHGGVRVAAVVVSARGRVAHVEPQALAQGITRQVRSQLGLPAPTDARIVVDKRATFRCTPSRPRLRADAFCSLASTRAEPGSPFARLALAGDYAWPDYPATLEAAVRSGNEAARLVAGAPARADQGGDPVADAR